MDANFHFALDSLLLAVSFTSYDLAAVLIGAGLLVTSVVMALINIDEMRGSREKQLLSGK